MGNYGITGFMDYLHGTDKSFVNSGRLHKYSVWMPFVKPRFEESVATDIKNQWGLRDLLVAAIYLHIRLLQSIVVKQKKMKKIFETLFSQAMN